MRTVLTALLLLLGLGTAPCAAFTLAPHEPLTRPVAERLLAEALRATGLDGAFELAIQRPRLPLGNSAGQATSLAVEGLRHEARAGRFSAQLVGRTGEALRFRLPVAGRVTTLIEVPVLARRLARGERLSEADLTWIGLRRERLPADGVIEAARLVGAEARRPLVAGRVLRARDIGPPVLVRRGQEVRLRYARPGLRLSTFGIAGDDGGVGAVVRVVNPNSRRQVQGVVTGAGEVTVGGTEPPAQTARSGR